MKLRSTIAIAAGKITRGGLGLLGKNGGALPGLIAEKLSPKVLADTLGALPDGVIVVTGTNGKTTTTKIITDILRGSGKHVLTNKMGSNFTRGIASEVVRTSSLGKNLPHDVAVIELDEAYAKKFVQIVRPSYVVALNVMRDQLDRFGEIDTTAQLIASAMQRATRGVIVNGNDVRLCNAAEKLTVPVRYYGVAKKLLEHFPADDDLLAVETTGDTMHGETSKKISVELSDFDGQHVTYTFDGTQKASGNLTLPGQYNFQNGAAALALVRELLPDTKPAYLIEQLSTVKPAFGRGEVISYDGKEVEIILIKNPSGFRLALASFENPADTLIAINDNDPDGRDVSWLWDVSFESLVSSSVYTTGSRAHDMALRLQYDNVPVGGSLPNLTAAVRQFMSLPPGNTKRIFCNYSAMLAIRKHFGEELRGVA